MKIEPTIALACKILREADADPKHPVYHGSSHNAQVDLSRVLLAYDTVVRAARYVATAECNHVDGCGNGIHSEWCPVACAARGLASALERLETP